MSNFLFLLASETCFFFLFNFQPVPFVVELRKLLGFFSVAIIGACVHVPTFDLEDESFTMVKVNPCRLSSNIEIVILYGRLLAASPQLLLLPKQSH